jgi:hypothetical protein
MFGSKKKQKNQGLPDLPPNMREIPSIRNYNRQGLEPMHINNQENHFSKENEIHGLPSFPDSPMKQGFSQSAIKDAVDTPDIKSGNISLPNISPPFKDNDEGIPDFTEHNEESNTIELEEWKPQMPKYSESQIPTMKQTQRFPETQQPLRTISQNKPVFIKLEKFREAKESLDIIRTKLTEMDELLKIIKDLKAKESQEITEWEKEVEKVKARINYVNSNIFENAI